LLTVHADQLRMQKWWSVLKDAAMSFAGDNAPRLGAALAYYTVFSIAPLILITITLAGAIFGEEAARGQVFTHMRQLIGDTGAEVVNEMVKDAARADTGAIAATLRPDQQHHAALAQLLDAAFQRRTPCGGELRVCSRKDRPGA
jgi:uncharacterized BrkB/YihY/UPF0761 family membrane protein